MSDFSFSALPAANLTGTLPAIDGSSLTGISATDLVRTDNQTDTIIGAYATNNYRFIGGVGPVRQYSRALSADEILKNFNAQKERFGL